MKFLNSSPSSSSSSTPESRISSSKYATSGCLPTVLRRLLCFNIFPTHPFDHHQIQFEQSHRNQEESAEFNELHDDTYKVNPGIVAKLMGLDSMPQRIHSGQDRKVQGNSVTRSRSMSYVDHVKESELMQVDNRRVNSTLSLREAPIFLDLENEEFFILSFEGGGKDKELKLKPRTPHKNLAEFKEKRAEFKEERSETRKSKCKRNKQSQEVPISQCLENDAEVSNSSDVHPLTITETESDSENSSPVSVLDFLDFPGHQQVPPSGKQDSKSESSNSRRKLAGVLESCKNASSSSPNNTNISKTDAGQANRSDKRCLRSRRNNLAVQNFDEMWGAICKLAEKEVTDPSCRMIKERWKGEDFEGICVHFELGILDQLILELIELFHNSIPHEDSF